MRLLVLGGTVFLSAAVATAAVRRGDEVVVACRGVSGPPPPGAGFVRWDRAEPMPQSLAEGGFDAVVDVARLPSQVRAAVTSVPGAHWVFVSSVSVYADHTTPGGAPGRTPLLDPIHEDLDPAASPETYGGMKVACEELVAEHATSVTVVRPGLVIGPGDPSGRFAYWPRRLERGGEVLAPGRADDAVQVIDVRDLAVWLVALAHRRVAGTFDAVGPVSPFAGLLGECGPSTGLTWVDHEFLRHHHVEPWAGPEAVPLWLPRPEYDGMLTHDPGPAREAGLHTREVAVTSRDTLRWLEATPDAPVTGIGPDRERYLLAAWHDRAR